MTNTFKPKLFLNLMKEVFEIEKRSFRIYDSNYRENLNSFPSHSDFISFKHQQFVIKYSAGSLSLKSLKNTHSILNQNELICKSKFIKSYSDWNSKNIETKFEENDKAVLYFSTGCNHECGSIELYKFFADKIKLAGTSSKNIRHLWRLKNQYSFENFVTLFGVKDIVLVNHSSVELVNLDIEPELDQYVIKYLWKKRSLKQQISKSFNINNKQKCELILLNINYFN